MENELVAMTADLLNGDDEVTGNITLGGTESIMLAVKSARDFARDSRPGIKDPEMILPGTGHPAFAKAADYLGIQIKIVPVGEDQRATTKNISSAISENTILIVASSPNFPYGVIDPIEEIGKLALQHNICFHVDACLGGFMLPFMDKTKYDLPHFDFRVPGVTSISADLHKFGYAPKGISIILYRNNEIRKKQFFVYTNWPGGIYASPTLSGSKSASSIAGAWALIKLLGFEGYSAIAKRVMDTAEKIRKGIVENADLDLISNPEMSNMAFISKTANILLIGDEMSKRGWHLDRLQFPNALHINVTQLNVGKEEEFIHDLNESVRDAKKISWGNVSSRVTISAVKGLSKLLPADKFKKIMSSNLDDPKGKAGTQKAVMYGIAGSLENREDLHEVIIEMLGRMYRG